MVLEAMAGEATGMLTPVEQDIETIREGLRLMLVNRLKDAEKHWVEARERTAKRKFNPGEHDPSGAFAFVGALTSLLHGLATLQNDQLAEAFERLQTADELTSQMKEWPGKTVIKGLCTLLMGMVQIFQGSKTHGVWLVLRSWLWLRLLESEALNYEGPERGLVRSTALLALGVFNLIISLLPTIFMHTATWCSGLSGERDVAMDFLRKCWKEDGLLAPFAAMVIVGYQVDVRTWLGEPQDAGFQEASEALDWAEGRFPGGIFIEGLRANYLAVSRDLPRALEVSDRMSAMEKEMPALGLVVHARRASYAQANLNWSEAALGFRNALAVYRKIDRRSLVPAMALNAALCHHFAGEEEQREEMISLILAYKARTDKKNWDFPDKIAFSKAESYKTGDWRPQITLFTAIIMHHRSSLFMSLDKVETLLGMLKDLENSDPEDVDTKCKALMLQAEVLRQSSRFEEALAHANRGLEYQDQLTKEQAKYGAGPYMLYVLAHANFYLGNLKEAKEALKKLDAAPRNHMLYFSILFKSTQLSKRLGLELKDNYLEVTVPNRDQLQFHVNIADGTSEVEWDFTLEDFSINFTAAFFPEGASPDATPSSPSSSASPGSEASPGPKKLLQSLDQYQAASGPVTGRYEPLGPGTLVLTFDNKFSLMRSKTLLLRVLPEHLILTEASK